MGVRFVTDRFEKKLFTKLRRSLWCSWPIVPTSEYGAAKATAYLGSLARFLDGPAWISS